MKYEMTRELGLGNKTMYQRAWRWGALVIAALSFGGVVQTGLAQTSWTNTSGSAEWFTAGSWSAGVPTLADEASLTVARVIKISDTNLTATASNLYINIGGLDVAGGSLNVAGLIDVGGNTSFRLSSGNVAFNGLNVSSGATYSDDDLSTLTLAGSNPSINVTSADAVTVKSLIIGDSLTKAGVGTLVLLNNNTYTNGTTISAGTLQLGNGGTTGSLGTGDITNNGTLAVNRSDTYTITNVVSGTGKLNQIGSGTTVLTADNTYSGGTSISNGIVQVGDGGSTGSLGSGGVTNHGTLIFNRSNNITVGNLITGTGSFRQLGSNTITLTADNDYTGTTTISSNGAVQVGDGGTSGSLGSGAVVNGGSLVFNRSDALTVSGGISGAGSVTNAGSGTTILAGNNSYSGLTVISAGTLQLGNGGSTGSLGTNQVINNGVLAFNRTNALTFANVISGSGSLTHLGSGSLTLSGTNTYSGGTTVNGGGTLQVINAAALGSGDFNLANGRLQVSSSSSAGLTINIGGNYVQGASGTLELGIGGSVAGSNQFDQLKITGGANLDGTLHVNSFNNYQAKHTDKIELIVATGGLSGTFSTFTNDITHSVLLTPELVYDADSVTLEWNQMSFLSFLAASNVNLTVNQAAAAVAVDSILTSTNATDVALVNHLNYLPDLTNGLPAAFDQVAPEELTAMMGAAFSAMDAQGNQFLRRVANLQLDYQRLYQSTLGRRTKTRAEFDAYVNRPWDLYFELPFNSASVASDANAPGYDLSSSGFTVGGDGRLSENVIVGAGINYLKTAGDPDSGGSVDMDTLSAQVYATWFNATGLHFEGLVGAGLNSYDTLRQGVGGVASGSADGMGFTTVIGGGYNWENGPWQFGPSLAFQYMNASIDEFTESGSLSPLRVDSQSEDAAHSQLGLSVRYNHQVGDSWTFITPEFSLAWRHDFLDESIALNSQFASGAGSSFVINGAEMGGDSFIIGFGCSVQWKPAFNTYLNLTLQRGSSGYDSEFLNLGLRYSF